MNTLYFKNPFAAFKYFTTELHKSNADIDALDYTLEKYLDKMIVDLCNLHYLLTGYKEYKQLAKFIINEKYLTKDINTKYILAQMNNTLKLKPYIDPEPILQLMQEKKNNLGMQELINGLKNINDIYYYALKYFPYCTREEAWFIYTLLKEEYFETDLNKFMQKNNIINASNIIYTNLTERIAL